jgi:hypothetical protein
MLKKDITYNDLDDNPITETFWFNFTQAEMAEMALEKEGKDGGFETWIKTMIESKDGAVLTSTFKKILLATIGERSADNKRFVKNDEIRNNFLFSDAYSVLFMELLTDADKMSAFINGIMPKAMREQTQDRIQAVVNAPDISSVPTPTINATPETGKEERPDWLKEGRVPTAEELKGATPEQIAEAFRLRGQQNS